MAWVIFSQDHDYHPTDSSTVAYKAGPAKVRVRRECADLAIAAGHADETAAPERDKTEGGDHEAPARR